MSKYYPPKHQEEKFHCILCGVFSKQSWHDLYIAVPNRNSIKSQFTSNLCEHCMKRCFWYGDRMIVPSEAPVPPPHQDIPVSCIEEYNEARDIVARSPRAAAALLRLCLQKLVKELGEKGKNIPSNVIRITISRDSPYVQKRYAKDVNFSDMMFLSDYRDGAFGRSVGLLVAEHMFLARAIIIVGVDGIVKYVQVVPEMTQLPDMDKAIEIACQFAEGV